MNRVKQRLCNLKRLRYGATWRFLFDVLTLPDADRLYRRLWQGKDPAKWPKQPEPWLTSAATDFLEKRMKNGWQVLEWGAGASSLWFTARGCNVTSIEHDKNWYNSLKQRLPTGYDLRLVEEREAYINPEIDFATLDMVLIDARWREACAEKVLEHIAAGRTKNGLLIVFDDANRAAYHKTLNHLGKQAKRQWHFTGPTGYDISKLTSVFEF